MFCSNQYKFNCTISFFSSNHRLKLYTGPTYIRWSRLVLVSLRNLNSYLAFSGCIYLIAFNLCQSTIKTFISHTDDHLSMTSVFCAVIASLDLLMYLQQVHVIWARLKEMLFWDDKHSTENNLIVYYSLLLVSEIL